MILFWNTHNQLMLKATLMIIVQENFPIKISNGESDSNGKALVVSEGEAKGHKRCTTILSSDGMPKSSVSSQTETNILSQQQSLRDQLSKSPGTAV